MSMANRKAEEGAAGGYSAYKYGEVAVLSSPEARNPNHTTAVAPFTKAEEGAAGGYSAFKYGEIAVLLSPEARNPNHATAVAPFTKAEEGATGGYSAYKYGEVAVLSSPEARNPNHATAVAPFTKAEEGAAGGYSACKYGEVAVLSSPEARNPNHATAVAPFTKAEEGAAGGYSAYKYGEVAVLSSPEARNPNHATAVAPFTICTCCVDDPHLSYRCWYRCCPIHGGVDASLQQVDHRSNVHCLQQPPQAKNSSGAYGDINDDDDWEELHKELMKEIETGLQEMMESYNDKNSALYKSSYHGNNEPEPEPDYEKLTSVFRGDGSFLSPWNWNPLGRETSQAGAAGSSSTCEANDSCINKGRKEPNPPMSMQLQPAGSFFFYDPHKLTAAALSSKKKRTRRMKSRNG